MYRHGNEYDKDELIKRGTKVAFKIAQEYNLPLKEVQFVRAGLYGLCNPREGVIKIMINWADDDEPINEMEFWRTIGHELAHFRYPNHEIDFWKFAKELTLRIGQEIGRKVRPEVAFFTRKGEVIY